MILLWLTVLGVVFIQTSNEHPLRRAEYDAYELIYSTDATTELTGSIRMFCRTSATAENVPISEVHFWLNYTTCDNSTSLQEREDVNV